MIVEDNSEAAFGIRFPVTAGSFSAKEGVGALSTADRLSSLFSTSPSFMKRNRKPTNRTYA